MSPHPFASKETLGTYHGEYIVSNEMLPVQRQQAYDEMLNLQKEFASDIYITRDREKYL